MWLNPAVVRDGALRTAAPVRTRPDYLRECCSPTLLSANFYTDAAEEQYERDKFEWGCRGGSCSST